MEHFPCILHAHALDIHRDSSLSYGAIFSRKTCSMPQASTYLCVYFTSVQRKVETLEIHAFFFYPRRCPFLFYLRTQTTPTSHAETTSVAWMLLSKDVFRWHCRCLQVVLSDGLSMLASLWCYGCFDRSGSVATKSQSSAVDV